MYGKKSAMDEPQRPDSQRYCPITPRVRTIDHLSVNSDMDERSPLLGSREIDDVEGSSERNRPPMPILYTRRWYILFIFSMLAFMQGCVWNTWGTIATSAEVAFDWTDADIALQANWGTITFIISAFFFAWLMDVKGIRVACVSVALLMFIGTGLRCISSDPAISKWLINTASILNGFGGTVAMAAPPLLSSTWFPIQERTRATAFACAMNGWGVGMSFIIGPQIVHLPSNRTSGDMLEQTLDKDFISQLTNSSTYTKEEIHKLRGDIMTLMYIEFGVVAAITAAMLIYFPPRPPTPPSISASVERVHFLKGLKDIVSHKGFWLLGGAYAVSSGVFNVWTAVIDVNLKPLGISESTAGYIGFTGIMAGNAVAILISIFADLFAKRMKSFLIVLYSVGAATFCIFALECGKYIPVHIEIFYVAMVVGSICVAGAVPLLFELVCESTYPIAEGLTNMCATLLNNVAGLIFLLVLMLPMESKMWMNWTVFASVAVCVPVFSIYKPKYTRLEVDAACIKQS